ncbi:hypothetical protein LAG73_16525 [Pseudoxanthomonas japonensis]|nr:hypothetical protein LAG73_16525 [Pseudoxanthomonas japonensis]
MGSDTRRKTETRRIESVLMGCGLLFAGLLFRPANAGVILDASSHGSTRYGLAMRPAGGDDFDDEQGLFFGVPEPAPLTLETRRDFLESESPGGAHHVQSASRHGWDVRAARARSVGYRKTETIEYHDDTGVWVLGQVKRTTTNGVETSRTEYGWKALPSRTYAFGKQQQTLGYYADGNLKSAKDGNGNATTYSGWKRGIPQRITHADGTSRTAAVNDAGWIISTTDENGYKTCYGHDAMGRLSRLIHPSETRAGICDAGRWAATTQVFEPVARAEYGLAAGHWRQTTSSGNARRVSYYDALWRPLLVREYDVANLAGTQRFSRFAYDHEGRTTFASYPGSTERLTAGIWTEYDALGRVTSVSQDSELGPLTTITQYRGDATGAFVRTISPRGVVTVTRHQAFDRPSYDTPVLVDQGQNLTERVGIDITRDVFGKPLSIRKRDAAGTVAVTRRFTYNSAQELCKIIEPETGTTVYGYDGAGNLAHSAMGLRGFGDAASCSGKGGWLQVKSRAAMRNYDARNRVKTLVFPDGRGNTTHTYTPDGLLASTAVDNDGTNVVTTSYGYNRRRLPTSERMQWGGINWGIGYGYDTLGHLASQSYPNRQSVHFAPNALGQATRAGTYATGVQYYPNGGMKQFTYGNGVVHTMTQNARQLPARSTDSNGVLDLGYLYDKHANVIGITDYTTGARQSRAMIYNGLDQLVRTTGPSFGTANYSYNVLDNLTSVKVTAGSHVRNHTYHYDATNRLTSVTNTVGGATVMGLGYDVQGNLRNQNGRVFNFDFGNRLRGVNGVASYVYDGHGRRVRDYTTASKYSLYSQSGQLVFDNDGRAGKSSQYVYLGGSLVAVREVAGSVATVKYQHTDALGTPIAVTDAAKAIVQTSEYEPYGQLTNRALTDGPGYTGHVQDAATGLTYMQQRYYDPVIGRFLSVDPVTAYSSPGANFNRYRYANNNPYKFIDPDGRKAKPIDPNARTGCGSSSCPSGGNKRTRDWDPSKGRGSDRIDTSDGPRVWVSPTGKGIRGCDGYGCGHNGARRAGGARQHLGSDFVSDAGQTVRAPTNGLIERRSNPYADDARYTGLQLRTDEGIVVKLWYVSPKAQIVGSEVAVGQEIGTAQDLSTKYRGNMTNHVHERITSPEGKNVDPASITWPLE